MMLRKSILFVLILLVTACGTNNAADDTSRGIDSLDPTRDRGSNMNSDFDNRLGYVRYTKDDYKTDQNHEHFVMNKEQMANTISRTILQNDGFEEVATLVTGKEVLIAYQKNDGIDENRADEIAKKAAMSITPRFYNIYVSNNANLMQDIHSLHNSTTTNNNYQNTIDNIIKEMDKGNKTD